MENNQNPLVGYFRKPEVYIALPSQGKYYKQGVLDLPPNGELGIYPMTARDELVLKTPDALLNGASTVEVIRSCVPAISDPWQVPSIDMDALLIAVRIATYGEQMDITIGCPKCQTKNDFGIDLTHLMDETKNWKFDDLLEVGDLKITFQPLNYKEINAESLRNFEESKIMKIVNNETIANGGDACGQTFAERSLDISASTGGEVYIGFRHHNSSDMFVLNIDDVSVTSSTMSNEEFILENIEYTFNQESGKLRVISEELLSNIQIYNVLGQQVLNQDLNDSSVVLNLSTLNSGVYIVNVEGNNSKIKTFKLAIK